MRRVKIEQRYGKALDNLVRDIKIAKTWADMLGEFEDIEVLNVFLDCLCGEEDEDTI